MRKKGRQSGQRKEPKKGLEVRSAMSYPRRTSTSVCKGNDKMVVRDETEGLGESSVRPIKGTGHLQRESRSIQILYRVKIWICNALA